MRASTPATFLAAILLLSACDRLSALPTGGELDPPSAEVALAPGLEPVTADFVGWTTGSFTCAPPVGGGPLPAEEIAPIRIAIWSGVEEPCTEQAPADAWVVILELSDSVSGTYAVGQACLGPLTALAGYGEVLAPGADPVIRRATEGSVTLSFLGFDRDAIAEGTFSFVLQGEAVPVTGTFRATSGCL